MEKEKNRNFQPNTDKRLVDMLREYAASSAYPFHMPGHKRNTGFPELEDFSGAFLLDITEIEGFDELYHAEGLLKDAQERARDYYGSKETFFCVNGSTGALHVAIASLWKGTGHLLVARNCHKAVFNGIYLTAEKEGKVDYIQPEWMEEMGIRGGISVEILEEKLSATAYDGLILTSPTYEGVLSDMERIVEIAHRHNVPVLVDEAHGAYFGMHPDLPVSAVKYGADLVVQSMHKTLPALTQTALLHVCGDRIDAQRVRENWEIFQTSSPSYLFMANMDACIRMLREKGDSLGQKLLDHKERILRQCRDLKHLKILDDTTLQEPGKILISVKDTDLNGSILYEKLVKDYDLMPEMAAGGYVLLMLTVMDREEGIDRLIRALKEIDASCTFSETEPDKKDAGLEDKLPKAACSIKQAMDGNVQKIALDEAIGSISAQFVYVYPPGAPVLIPGEVVEKREADQIKRAFEDGLHVQGLNENTLLLKVVKA